MVPVQNRVVKPGAEQAKAAPQEAGSEGKEEDKAAKVEFEEKDASKQEASEGQEKGDGEGEESGAKGEEELEAAKADREWARHLAQDNSVIYDLFSGQLQSTIKCHKCSRRFTT